MGAYSSDEIANLRAEANVDSEPTFIERVVARIKAHGLEVKKIGHNKPVAKQLDDGRKQIIRRALIDVQAGERYLGYVTVDQIVTMAPGKVTKVEHGNFGYSTLALKRALGLPDTF